MANDTSDLTLICPNNDPEAYTILKIARKLGIDVMVSEQPHGGRLNREPASAFENLKHRVAIVETLGPDIEEKLGHQGHEVIIIDNHQYIKDGYDRRHPLSSLEQFADLVGYKLSRLEKGIGIADRSYVYGLLKEGYPKQEIEEIFTYADS